MTGSARIAVDIGGTFTDFVLLAGDGTSYSAKVSSTPARPEEAVLTGIAQLLATAGIPASEVGSVLHGTTVGSNALLQKAGAKTGLITTRGFRDVLEIGRVRTPTMFDLSWRKPEPLVRRRHRMEVGERTGARGEIVAAVDLDAVREAGRFLAAEGVESIAICFINSHVNPANEVAAARALREAVPGIAVTESVAVLAQSGEYERTSTTAVNAYVLPVLEGYIARLEGALAELGISAPLLIGNSNGGLSAATVAREKPVFFISSGRAAGAVGGSRLGTATAEKDLVVFDMGGTTASAVLIEKGELSRTHEYEFRAGISTPSRFIKAGGYMMRVPTIDVAEVGSGAGSIAAIDAGGLLHVGPVSAGALPGPVCYGKGGVRPTVTDANVVLGLLPPVLAGGAVKLDVAAAREAIARDLGAPLGLSAEDAALGVREVVNGNMARAVRAVTVERGVDPRDFTLLAFGGSGPVHACDLAASLGMKRVLFPEAPGVFTAMGMLAGEVEHHDVRAWLSPLAALDRAALATTMAAMRDDGLATMARQGHDAARITAAFALDLRYRGQEAAITVPLTADEAAIDPDTLREAFLAAYRTMYGYVSRDTIESAAVRLVARAEGQVLDFAGLKRPPGRALRPETRRPVRFSRSGWTETRILDAAAVGATPVAGPVILESDDSTIVIPPGATVARDPTGHLVANLGGAA
ncbi:MAG: hydantoinase/oxoprolinase family protein [Rhizobiales bacterium]|nr:hydantoinase/oxoprolinase family protein [Hyphomicrobiales bacterium]